MSERVAVVAGASGAVGTALVEVLLAREEVSRVVCVVRKPLAAPTLAGTNAKLEQRTANFTALTADDLPKDATDAYCALGTTIKIAGSREAFAAVDKTAVLAFAQAARQVGCKQLVLVSSLGADARSTSFYLRIKGEVEDAVRAMGFHTVHIVRPSILDRPGTNRAGERAGLWVANGLSRVLGKQWTYAPIHVNTVARAMVALANQPHSPGTHVHLSPTLQGLGA